LLDFASFAPTKIPLLAKASKVVEPFSLLKNVTKPIAGKVIPQVAAEKLYQSAAKFSNTLSPQQRSQMLRTALDEGIMPTSVGVALVEDRAAILNHTLDNLIDSHVAAGTEVPVNAVFMHFKELRQAKGGVKIEAMKDTNTINKIAGEFVAGLKGRTTVTVKELQELKKDIYSKVKYNANTLGKKGSMAKEDTFKAVGRGAKDLVSERIPEAAEINKMLGDLYNLQPHLIRAAQRIENNNIVSLGGGMKMGTGGIIGATSGSPIIGIGAGIIAHIFSTPKMKARFAIAINKLKAGNVDWLNKNSHWPEVRVALALAGRAEIADENRTEQSDQEQN